MWWIWTGVFLLLIRIFLRAPYGDMLDWAMRLPIRYFNRLSNDSSSLLFNNVISLKTIWITSL